MSTTACKGDPGKVEGLVEGKFKASGIRVTGKGEISAEQIDKNLFIDTHYGAIASKAGKLVLGIIDLSILKEEGKTFLMLGSLPTIFFSFPFITVKLQPSELNVPDKGKKQFQAAFGESWDSAIAAGKVYNAKDGAKKLGLDSEGVNAEWSKLTSGKNLIKFGGGFYCGKVKDIYIMNGFYMSMRAGEYRAGGATVFPFVFVV